MIGRQVARVLTLRSDGYSNWNSAVAMETAVFLNVLFFRKFDAFSLLFYNFEFGNRNVYKYIPAILYPLLHV